MDRGPDHRWCGIRATDLFSPKGILLGAYAVRADADELAERPLREQFELTRAAIEGLHPGRGRELEKPMAVAWSKVPHSLGIAARWQSRPGERVRAAQPTGRPVLFRRRTSEPARRLAGGRGSLGVACDNMIDKHRRERTGVRGQPTVYFGGHGPA